MPFPFFLLHAFPRIGVYIRIMFKDFYEGSQSSLILIDWEVVRGSPAPLRLFAWRLRLHWV